MYQVVLEFLIFLNRTFAFFLIHSFGAEYLIV